MQGRYQSNNLFTLWASQKMQDEQDKLKLSASATFKEDLHTNQYILYQINIGGDYLIKGLNL